MLFLRPHLQTLKGASFSVAELTFAKTWSHDNNLQLIIRLDHGAPGEEYEEALVFRHTDIRLRQWIIWRNAEAVLSSRSSDGAGATPPLLRRWKA
jgi:hypothetical protein